MEKNQIKKYDVFISYSNKDVNVANAACHKLEENRIRCWIAPRDIRPGDIWADTINQAIKASKVFVLIFSENSNNSNQVSKELTLAVNSHLMIFPFKITDTSPTGAFEYYLADTHWLDAITLPMDKSISHMKDVIATYLNTSKIDNFLVSKKKSKKLHMVLIILGILAVLITGLFVFSKGLQNSELKHHQVESNATIVTELESNMSLNKAKDIVADVISRRPITAYGFDDSNHTRIAALLNENEEEASPPGGLNVWDPKFRLVVLEKEAGVWRKESDRIINMDCFYKSVKGNNIVDDFSDAFILFEIDESCNVFKVVGQTYLYFHDFRTVGGVATADVLNDFVALNLSDGSISIIKYLEDIDRGYKDNGSLYKFEPYPVGVEDYLLHKLEKDKSIKKIEK